MLPKIELHLHLDCSLGFQAACRFDPGMTRPRFEAEFNAPEKCLDLPDFLSRARNGIAMMQTSDRLRIVTIDLLEQLRAENVLYAEIRFAPFEHLRQGLQPEAVVETVLEAIEEGKRQTGVDAGLLLCTLRELPEEKSLLSAKLAARYHGQGVVGFDIAGNEADFPVDAHISAFRLAREYGVPCIAHAGEARGPDGIWEVLLNFGVVRLGHGVRSIEDPQLVAYLVEKGVHLEVCPSSNIQTNVYDTMADHPVDRLLRAGVSAGINTDSRTLTNTTLEREYKLLGQYFGWGKEELLRCNINAARAAFLPEEKKQDLIRRLEAGFGKNQQP
ncbi:MAG: adenosine deaminase [Saprospiraceae bacterium]